MDVGLGHIHSGVVDGSVWMVKLGQPWSAVVVWSLVSSARELLLRLQE